MNRADFTTASSGFPMESDTTLEFMQNAYTEALLGVAKMAGLNNVILSGLNISGTTATEGWIIYNNELLYFEGGTVQSTFVIEQTVVQKANVNSQLYDRYFTRKAKFGIGTNAIAFNTLYRVDSIQTVMNRMGLMLFENEVIVKGCEVSNISGSNLSIASGVVVINGRWITAPSYNGTYPIHLTEAGQWLSNAPASNFITFDPHSSQRWADVIKRASSPNGEVMIRTVLTDRLDNTGLGKWELKGWALMNGANGTLDMRSRFPLAYDNRTTDPNDNVWSAGNSNIGVGSGAKSVNILINNMPSHNHTNVGNDADPYPTPVPNSEYGLVKRGATGGEYGSVVQVDSVSSVNEPILIIPPANIPYQGEGQPLDIRNPYLVLVYLQRI